MAGKRSTIGEHCEGGIHTNVATFISTYIRADRETNAWTGRETERQSYAAHTLEQSMLRRSLSELRLSIISSAWLCLLWPLTSHCPPKRHLSPVIRVVGVPGVQLSELCRAPLTDPRLFLPPPRRCLLLFFGIRITFNLGPRRRDQTVNHGLDGMILHEQTVLFRLYFECGKR